MADIRIADTMALTRGLDQFRHLDQQERALAERVAAQVTEHKLIEQKKDVEETDHAVADRSDEGSSAEYHGSGQKRGKNEEPPSPPEEVKEGHLIDLKA